MTAEQADYFSSLANQQRPELLWIGCSDSRVPANQLLKLPPGEVFVHRNIANIIHAADLNSHSVLQYSVDVLKVKHIIVCGHYNCGGVAAALTNEQYGLVDHWVRTIKDLYAVHEEKLKPLPADVRLERLVELNVARSVDAVAHSTIVQNAWGRGQELTIHGWCYKLTDGLIKDLQMTITGIQDIKGVHKLVVGP
ncbi:carbonic anhydrase [Blyttiomyces helicus]|uniref:Carbonic anhydrase n=1 Tax=Blyttiomyces helicus TaxID=388810 RepID=A0A4P9WE44_9FUNG|nr:carbonic anhydrase [Blyttiomyces helicus]|eukprot:RKO90854.1 carbonic anhydrase [Blyttiomyces helicus]